MAHDLELMVETGGGGHSGDGCCVSFGLTRSSMQSTCQCSIGWLDPPNQLGR